MEKKDKSVELSPEVLQSMVPGQTFELKAAGGAPVNSVDFSFDGRIVATAGNDHAIRLFDALEGKARHVVHCKRAGAACVTFTHHPSSVLVAGNNGWDHSIRYHATHDNKVLRYFKGHTERVICVGMSPVDDVFLSGSVDGTLRLWDLRTTLCQGLMQADLPASGVLPVSVAFDPLGVVFATATAPNAIKLFDVRQFANGPFDVFSLDGVGEDITRVRFSPDGKLLVVCCASGRVLVVDAFKGFVVRQFNTSWNVSDTPVPFDASFSPDSRCLIAGSDSGVINVWHIESGSLVCRWHGHSRPVPCVKWNPRYCSVASACHNLTLWCPSS